MSSTASAPNARMHASYIPAPSLLPLRTSDLARQYILGIRSLDSITTDNLRSPCMMFLSSRVTRCCRMISRAEWHTPPHHRFPLQRMYSLLAKWRVHLTGSPRTPGSISVRHIRSPFIRHCPRTPLVSSITVSPTMAR